MFDELNECPVNDQFRPSLQLEFVDRLHFEHQKRIEDEATEQYINVYVRTGNLEKAKDAYFTHLHLYL